MTGRGGGLATGQFNGGTISHLAGVASARLNRVVELFCAFLALVLVLDVWLGVFVRYVWPMPITFTEEAARYLMIWMALLAISCGIARREHIGVALLFDALPRALRRPAQIVLDLVGLAFFLVIFWYGLGFAEKGWTRITMIYGMPKFWPNLSVPVAAGLAIVQTVLVLLRDGFRPDGPAAVSQREVPA